MSATCLPAVYPGSLLREINAEGNDPAVEQNAHLALRLAQRGYVPQTGTIELEESGANLLANPRCAPPTWGSDRGRVAML